jgi:5-methyltetrahydropteroyltriglutamate--homocysteine methyltransferase
MQRTKPPFRADEVGSLLRPPRIKEARAKLEKGEITAEDLRKAEDIEIEKVVHKQASIGLKLATDGEFRRSWWHFDNCFTPKPGSSSPACRPAMTPSA